METKKLIKTLEFQFPKKIAKKYHDYVGLMIGKLPLNVHKILLCLDFDETILDEALKFKPDLIITHHPFIYGKKKNVLKYDIKKKELCSILQKNNIPVYSAHTNFDEGIGGMNDALSLKLGLLNVRPLSTNPMARGGDLPKPMFLGEFASYARKVFDADYASLIDEGTKEIKK
ncbi:MAG: Nif3-like dinuclear metal center hexameric protein, partial [Bacilli bacterium]|nr:Nif3-like dinuclear metal center hexameric protein [Bacilli bacterium]